MRLSLCVSLSRPMPDSLALCNFCQQTCSANVTLHFQNAVPLIVDSWYFSIFCGEMHLNCFYNLEFSSKSQALKQWMNLILKHKTEQKHWFSFLYSTHNSAATAAAAATEAAPRQCLTNAWWVLVWRGVGGTEKWTGRVTNGRRPGCQLTVTVLHGGLVMKMTKRGKKERRRGQKEGVVTSGTPKRGDLQRKRVRYRTWLCLMAFIGFYTESKSVTTYWLPLRLETAVNDNSNTQICKGRSQWFRTDGAVLCKKNNCSKER